MPLKTHPASPILAALIVLAALAPGANALAQSTPATPPEVVVVPSEPPDDTERSVSADLRVRRGDEEVSFAVDAATANPDDEIVLRLRVPGRPRRGMSFELRFAHAMLGSVIASAIGAGVGLLTTAWNEDAVGYGALGGALFGSPIGASVGAALGTRSDAGSVLGAVTGIPVGWGLGGVAGVGALASGAPPEAALATAWVATTLLSGLVACAWTEIDERGFRRAAKGREARVSDGVRVTWVPGRFRAQFF